MTKDDALLVDGGAQYGFAYYTTTFTPTFTASSVPATGFAVASDPAHHLVMALSTEGDTASSIVRKVAAARRLTGPNGRVFILRTHEPLWVRRAYARIHAVEQHKWPGTHVMVL